MGPHICHRLLLLLLPLPLAAQDKITFEDHVFPIFEQACLNCHNPDKTKGGLDLSNFGGAMKGGSGGKIAEPGDTGSKLIAVVMQTAEPKMPPEGDKLSGEQIDVLRAWVEGGLLETRNSKARKPSKPKFDLALKSDPSAKPDGPPPMPEHVTLEPVIVTPRPSAIHAMAASPWAPLIAVTGQRQVLLFETGSQQLAGVLPFPEGDPVSLAFTPNGRYLIVGGGIPGKNGLTVTFDVTTGARILTAAKEFDTVLAADLRPDLGTVATGSPSRLIKLWKTEDGSQTASIKKHTDWITALDFSPDGILLATGDRNGGVWVWEAGTGGEFHTLRGHQAGITATAFRADSNVLASASEDGSIRFWEMSSGNEIKKIDAHPGGVLGLSWARDGSLATVGRDHKAKLWKPDFNALREIKDLPDLPTAVALDAEGKTVFVADYRGIITSYSVEKGEKTGEFDANPPAIATRIANLRGELDAHPAKIDASEKSRTEISQQLEEAKQRVAKAEAAISEARQRQQQAEQQIAETRKQDEQVGSQLDQKRKELEQRREESRKLREQMEQHQRTVADLEPKIESARREAETATDDTERWKNELASLTKQRDEQAAARQSLADKAGELEQQTAAMEQETKQLQAKRETFPEIIKTAERTREEARKAIPESEKQLAELRKAVPPAEEKLKQAEAELAAVKAEHEALEKRLAHWVAADLNARSITAAEEAALLASENEVLAADFADLTRQVESKGAELNAKRQEHRNAVDALEKATEPAETEKLSAAADGLDREVGKLADDLHRLEQRLIEIRRELDERLPEAHRLKTEAEELKQRYLQS